MKLAVSILVLILLLKLIGVLLGLAFKFAIIAGIVYLAYQIYNTYLLDMFR